MDGDRKCLIITKEIEECKNPPLVEIWNWEGDLSILPFKWTDLLKNAGINVDKNLKEYLKINYYDNPNFDKRGFFFITSRSDTMGCAYLDNDTIKYLCVHKRHLNKGVENSLIKLCVRRFKEKDENATFIYIDKSTTNVDLDNLIFK